MGSNPITIISPPGSNGNALCSALLTGGPQEHVNVTCRRAVTGRYVSVQRIGVTDERLALCDVKVRGKLVMWWMHLGRGGMCNHMHHQAKLRYR